MDRRALMREVDFAKHLDDEVLDALAASTATMRVERGAIVTLEGEPAEAMYLVAAGRVKIVRYSPDAVKRHIRRISFVRNARPPRIGDCTSSSP